MIGAADSPNKLLKLRIEDAEDVIAIAPLLQDALVPIVDVALIDFSPQGIGQQFILIASRFCWEKSCTANQEKTSERVHTALVFGNVKSVQYKNIDRENKDLVLSLLTVGLNQNVVSLFFAKDAVIKIEVQELDCVLQDMADPWPTRFVPDHEIAE